MTKKIIVALSAFCVFLIAAQVGDPDEYQGLVQLVIFLLVGFLGAPISQWLRNALNAIFGKEIEDRWAILLTGVVATLLAVGEMWYTGQLADISIPWFIANVTAIYGLASLYFGWLKGSDGFFGTGFLLRGYKKT